MFNMGFTELIVLGVFALIVIGPKQLPEVARVVGRMINEFKRATGDFTASISNVKHQANQYMQKTEDSIRDHVEIAKKEMAEAANLARDEDLNQDFHHGEPGEERFHADDNTAPQESDPPLASSPAGKDKSKKDQV
ncbi:MAG: twin-arginine translocase TatA/TatE family subunit [Bdellovibrionaceae bacterium]|nr:twin-arginine translocase TatA/TatE family subunit [Bdellovibrionales bacterium]MCB9085495.1 twin-arginine translocase TatA/TatE family subunit [Pseudobdellovibrionaceae bacterium]